MISEYLRWWMVYLYLTYFIWSKICIWAPSRRYRYRVGPWCVLGLFSNKPSICIEQYSHSHMPNICFLVKLLYLGSFLESHIWRGPLCILDLRRNKPSICTDRYSRLLIYNIFYCGRVLCLIYFLELKV